MALCKDIKPVYGCKSPGMRDNFLPDPKADPPGATHHKDSLCQEKQETADRPVAPDSGILIQKNRLVMDESVYGRTVADPIRLNSGLYWITDQQRNLNTSQLETISKYFPSLSVSKKNELAREEEFDLRVSSAFIGNKPGQKDKIDTTGNIYGERRVVINIEPRQGTKNQYTPARWNLIANRFKNQTENKVFYDHVFTIRLPYDEKDLKEFTALQQDRSRVNFNFEYNYFVKEYEDLMNSALIPHRILPHLYAFESERYNRRAEAIDSRNVREPWKNLSNEEKLDFVVANFGFTRQAAKNNNFINDPKAEREYKKQYPQSERRLSKSYYGFRHHINLASETFTNAFGEINPNIFDQDVIYVPDDEKFRYFQKWSQVFDSLNKNIPNFYQFGLAAVDRKYFNTAITADNYEELCIPSDGFNSKRELFPMFVQMRFPTDVRERNEPLTKMKAADLIDDNNLSIPIIGYTMELINKNPMFSAFQVELERNINEDTKEYPFFNGSRISRLGRLIPWSLLSTALKLTFISQVTSFAPADAGAQALLNNAGIIQQYNAQKNPSQDFLSANVSPSLPLANVVNFFHNDISQTYRTIIQFPSNVQHGARRVLNLIAMIELYNKFETSQAEKLENPDALKIFDGKELDIGVILGTYPIDVKKFNKKGYKLFKSLMLFLFSTGLKDLLKVGNKEPSTKIKFDGHSRSFEEMLQGRPAESETVFYRIEKRLGSTGEVIQNFYIPNNSRIDVAEWVDTQVRYNEKYIYQIYAYELVYGTAYNYENFKIDANNKTATVDALYRPSLVLVEEPYFMTSGVILDTPPVAPDVDILSYVDDNSKVVMSLTSNTGDRFLEPIIIDEQEEQYINNLPNSIARFITEVEDNKVVTKFKVRYKNDDPINTYVVYKIDYRPTSYADFAGTSVSVRSSVGGTSAAYTDTDIMPNKKYYYVFRSVDVHGHLSYPSPIYEVEMVDEAGMIYLEVETIDLREDESKSHAKHMKRYLMISPAAAQSVVNFAETSQYDYAKDKSANLLDDVKLGIREKSAYGRKYKLRLTSKSTGRKIDINFRFNREHEKMPETIYEIKGKKGIKLPKQGTGPSN